ncbi:MAG TPA: hypothetical protein VFU15_13505 [Bacteroidia bacterium]|nr:hypothetical protein [Bacteroidia bacterium]
MRWFGRIILGALAFCAFALLFGWATMALWNWLMPSLFHLPVLTSFWQAVGLIILGKLLFGGFGKHGCRHCGHRGWRHHRGHWRRRWEEKMANMTPEERERVMKGMRHCDWWDQKWDDKNMGKDTADTPQQ